MSIADADVAAVARLLGEPARAAMLTVLLDGRAHPAGVLASAAGVGRPAASAHLQRLVAAGLVRVRRQGRHRYHELAGPEVARVLEALAVIAPPLPVRGLRQSREAVRLSVARTCYDHLAGRAGVVLRDALLDHELLDRSGPREHRVTAHGRELLGRLGAEPARLDRTRRLLAYDCLDWTERSPHLGGALPAALLRDFLDLGWLTRHPRGRGVDVRDAGWAGLRSWLGCSGTCHALGAASANAEPGSRARPGSR